MKTANTPKTTDEARAHATSLAIRHLLVAADPAFYERTGEGLEAIEAGRKISLTEFRKQIGR